MSTKNRSSNNIGADRLALYSLPQIKERISFLYLERCIVNRQSNAISVTDSRGAVFVPSALLSVILLGPGTKVTHRAMELIGDSGITVIWVGEQGVRYYAHGRPLTHSSRLLIAQAALVSSPRSRVTVARNMYAMRFPDEDVSKMTMQQLRGREGARVRSAYRSMSRKTGVSWNGRDYNPDDYESGNAVNKALSAAHTCLYGVVHSVIAALGCSPGLGFIHTGHERSFVYDIADLYKVEITVPIAFIIAKDHSEEDDIGSITRRSVRDRIMGENLLFRAVRDIRRLLIGDAEEDDAEVNVIYLWDDKNGFIKNAVSYGREYDIGDTADDDDFVGAADDGVDDGGTGDIAVDSGYGEIIGDE